MPPILWPTFLLVALIWAVWFAMFLQRGRLMRAKPPTKEDFATGEAALRYFQPVEMPANNLRNLFEMPVLYFALVPLMILGNGATPIQLGCAWAFVALRYAHSFQHLSGRGVTMRFVFYALSNVALFAMWLGFFLDLVIARNAV